MKKFLSLVLALTVLQFLSLNSIRAQESEDEVITVEEEAEPTASPAKPVDEVEDVVELEVDVEATPEATAAATEAATEAPTEEPSPAVTAEASPEATEAATAEPVSEERMKDVYEKGIDLYQRKRYAEALEELDRACGFKKGSAQAWLFAEAHAMRGVIYQFYIKSSGHKEKAREAYSTALEWDPQNKAAKRHIREVR